VPGKEKLGLQHAQQAMEQAMHQARLAFARGEVPVGAVVTGEDGQILAARGNQVEGDHDASAHAEILALREAAAKMGSPRLTGCTLWVTLEPCPMCATAASFFRVKRLVFGAYDAKGGGVEHGPRIFAAPGCLHQSELVGGVRESESAELLRSFFAGKR